MLTCKDVSKLLSRAREERLGLWERLGLELHLMMCKGCTNFRKQLDFISAAMRRYGGREE